MQVLVSSTDWLCLFIPENSLSSITQQNLTLRVSTTKSSLHRTLILVHSLKGSRKCHPSKPYCKCRSHFLLGNIIAYTKPTYPSYPPPENCNEEITLITKPQSVFNKGKISEKTTNKASLTYRISVYSLSQNELHHSANLAPF